MTYSYSNEIKFSQSAIRTYGAAANLTRSGTSYPCNALFDKFTEMERATLMIRNEDRKVYLAAADLSFAPDPQTDQLIVGSDTYQIVTSNPIAPGYINILFICQVRLI